MKIILCMYWDLSFTVTFGPGCIKYNWLKMGKRFCKERQRTFNFNGVDFHSLPIASECSK